MRCAHLQSLHTGGNCKLFEGTARGLHFPCHILAFGCFQWAQKENLGWKNKILQRWVVTQMCRRRIGKRAELKLHFFRWLKETAAQSRQGGKRKESLMEDTQTVDVLVLLWETNWTFNLQRPNGQLLFYISTTETPCISGSISVRNDRIKYLQ